MPRVVRSMVQANATGSPAKDSGHLLRRCRQCQALFLGHYFAQLCDEHRHLEPIAKGRPPGPIKRRKL